MLETPLGDRLVAAAEWWRDRDLGLGFVAPLPRGVTLYAAWLRSPLGRARDGLVVEVGGTF